MGFVASRPGTLDHSAASALSVPAASFYTAPGIGPALVVTDPPRVV
ncbi:MAG: hypothetical protein HOP15_14155 [Planctomycetes bacterium]|nr:hypothetical protein [Planctomycetota bacterium]